MSEANNIKNYIKSYKSNIIFFLLSIPSILIILIIRPLIKIKVGQLESRKIGHFSSPIEIYLNEVKLKLIKIKKNEIHLFYCEYKISNNYLLSHWKKNLIILPRLFLEPLFFFFNSSKYFKKFTVNITRLNFLYEPKKSINLSYQADVNQVLSKTVSSIKFSNQEILIGNKILDNLGLKSNQEIVCFANRDESFFEEKFVSERNAEISTYKNAMKYLANKNFFCIRVGRSQLKKIDFSHKNIIDYPFSNIKSDFMDLFLFSKCIFLISTNHGINELASLFRKKRMIINLFPQNLHCLNNLTPLIILKKFKNLKNNQYISFKEVFEKKIYLISKIDLKSYGYDLIDNSEEEILDATKDMYELYNNNFKIEFSEQEKFWSIYKKNFNYKPNHLMIGKTFFKKNYDLFV